MKRRISLPSRVVASLLAFCILAGAPGYEAYAAAGRVVEIRLQSPPIGAAARPGVPQANMPAVGTGLPGSALFTPDTSLPGLQGAPGAQALFQGDTRLAADETRRALAADPLRQKWKDNQPQGASPAPLQPAPLAGTADGVKETVPSLEVSGAIGRPGRIADHFRALRDLFKARFTSAPEGSEPVTAASQDGTAPKSSEAHLAANPSQAPPGSATPAEAQPGQAAPPAPPAAKKDGGNGGGFKWLGLGFSAVMLIVSLIVSQVGVEAQWAALPGLLEKTFGDFSFIADVMIVKSLASVAGRVVAPFVAGRFSRRTAYVGSLGLKLGSMVVMTALLATGHLALPGLVIFFAVDGFLGGLSLAIERIIVTELTEKDEEKMDLYSGWKQSLLETIGTLGPIATAALVAKFSFMPFMYAFPIAAFFSILIVWKTLRIPEKIEAARRLDLQKAAAQGKKAAAGAGFGDFWQKLKNGARVVWADRVLRTTFLAYTGYMMLNPFLYSALAPAYGMRLIGTQNPELASSVSNMLTGFYSFGGLVGGLMMLAEQRKLKRSKPAQGAQAATGQETQDRLRKSMLRWMGWGIVGLAAFATLAFPSPLLGSLVALPGFLAWAAVVTIPAVALIPFGIAQVVANLKLENFFAAKAPEKDQNDSISFLLYASMLISTIGVMTLKFLIKGKLLFGIQPIAAFTGLAGFGPFAVVAVLMLPLGGFLLYLVRRLASLSRSSSAPAAAPPSKP